MSHPEDQRGPESGAREGASGSDEALSPAAQLDQARSEADEQRRKAETYLDLAQRTQADFLNYKRRTTQELEQKVKDANAGLLTQLLPIFDDLQRALTSVPADLAEHSWAQGIGLIGQKLEHVLQLQGLERIGGEGDVFDPRVHEAVAYEEHPVYDEGQVASVYRVGYRLNDRVLRPAQVVVARGSARPPASAGGESRSVGEGTAHP
ncbi:MAG: nucleotide exchange factor GrpE [Propionibacteriaceae bacterium]|nr:nucleotide exchange factor GrpE [Propionibacteriaceae bacterium]